MYLYRDFIKAKVYALRVRGPLGLDKRSRGYPVKLRGVGVRASCEGSGLKAFWSLVNLGPSREEGLGFPGMSLGLGSDGAACGPGFDCSCACSNVAPTTTAYCDDGHHYHRRCRRHQHRHHHQPYKPHGQAVFAPDCASLCQSFAGPSSALSRCRECTLRVEELLIVVIVVPFSGLTSFMSSIRRGTHKRGATIDTL